MQEIIGLNKKQIIQNLKNDNINDVERRVQKVWKEIYNNGTNKFEDIQYLASNTKNILSKKFGLNRPEITQKQVSEDGTIKWLLSLDDQTKIETVYIPENNRGTLCLSSQAGCTLNCTFCYTGTQKLQRNLTANEIIMQIVVAAEQLNDFPRNKPDRKITTIVMMGMGEPLLNYQNLKQALNIITDKNGMDFGKRRVTVSTAGIVPFIKKAGEEIGCALAISLHATNDELRNKLVPINKKYPLEQLISACKNYPGVCNAKRITFEYVMLKDVNDSIEDAKNLVRLLEGVHAKINLIPFNPWPNAPFQCSEWEQIETFADYINDNGYAAPIRTPRGRDILAACGQLKSINA